MSEIKTSKPDFAREYRLHHKERVCPYFVSRKSSYFRNFPRTVIPVVRGTVELNHRMESEIGSLDRL
jgi:hypothetical protein